MNKSKTQIEKQLKKKSNSILVETIIAAKKKDAWNDVAGILAGSRRNHVNPNLEELEKIADGKSVIVIPGKVLSQGEITKKCKVVAMGFSEKAREKLLKAGCEVLTLLEEIKKNPEAKGIRVFNK